ncbi:uncharacterized protein LOC144120034 [Amblyomma americanum]
MADRSAEASTSTSSIVPTPVYREMQERMDHEEMRRMRPFLVWWCVAFLLLSAFLTYMLVKLLQAVTLSALRVQQTTSVRPDYTSTTATTSIITTKPSKTTTTTSTTLAEPPPVTVPTGPPKRKDIPEQLRQAVFCGVGESFSVISLPPIEGSCDCIFYDSLYRHGKNNLTGDFEEPLKDYIGHAYSVSARNRGPKYGLSFSLENDYLFQDFANTKFSYSIENLYKQSMGFFGALNLYGPAVSPSALKRTLYVLESIGDLMWWAVPFQPLLGIGVSVDNSADHAHILKLLKSSFVPHFIISISHLSYADYDRPDCTIMPLTVLKFPEGVRPSYGHTLGDSAELLAEIFNAQIDVAMAISFTMQGRWYAPKYESEREKANGSMWQSAFFTSCQKPPPSFRSNMSPTQACTLYKDFGNLLRNLYYNSTVEAAIGLYESDARLLYTFEAEQSLRAKMCAFKEAYPWMKFGVAIYDTELDGRIGNESPTCSNIMNLNEGFQRVYMLQQILETLHLLAPTWTKENSANCSSFPINKIREGYTV